MKKNNYTGYKRKMRQLKSIAKQLKQALHMPSQEVDLLISRAKRLVNELRQVFAGWQLKKVLGPACFLVGISFANTGSAQNFLAPVQNPFGLTMVTYNSNPAFVDLDNDGDFDLMVGSYNGDFNYFENSGTSGAPSFTTAAQVNSFGLTAGYYFATPAFADIDNDGDKDMISTEYGGNFNYYENTGTATAPTFTASVQNPFGLAAVNIFGTPTFGDLDNDGDKDLMVGEVGGNMQYFQNIGTATAPSFTAAVQNPFGLTAVGSGTAPISSPEFIDLDTDGDLDLMVNDNNGDFQYFENMGTAASPSFAAPLTNPYNLVAVNKYAMMSFADLDNDGDKDLMVGDYDGNLNYFENAIPLGIKSTTAKNDMRIYPNPATDYVQITGEWVPYIAKVEVMDISGRTVITQNSAKPLQVKELAAGIYTVKITHQNGSFEVKKLQKQ